MLLGVVVICIFFEGSCSGNDRGYSERKSSFMFIPAKFVIGNAPINHIFDGICGFNLRLKGWPELASLEFNSSIYSRRARKSNNWLDGIVRSLGSDCVIHYVNNKVINDGRHPACVSTM